MTDSNTPSAASVLQIDLEGPDYSFGTPNFDEHLAFDEGRGRQDSLSQIGLGELLQLPAGFEHRHHAPG